MDIPVVGTVYDSSNNICADNIDFGMQVTIQSGNTGQYYVDYKLFGLLSVARTHMEVVDEKYIYSGGFQVGIYQDFCESIDSGSGTGNPDLALSVGKTKMYGGYRRRTVPDRSRIWKQLSSHCSKLL